MGKKKINSLMPKKLISVRLPKSMLRQLENMDGSTRTQKIEILIKQGFKNNNEKKRRLATCSIYMLALFIMAYQWYLVVMV